MGRNFLKGQKVNSINLLLKRPKFEAVILDEDESGRAVLRQAPGVLNIADER